MFSTKVKALSSTIDSPQLVQRFGDGTAETVVDGQIVRIGRSVAINDAGNIIAASDPADVRFTSNVGVVSIFKKINNVWSQSPTLFKPNTDFRRGSNNNFGISLAMSSSGEFIFVGAPGIINFNNPDAGRIYVYRNTDLSNSASTWTYIQVIQPNDAIAYTTQFGKSIACNFDGTRLVVDTSFRTNKYVYVWNGTQFVKQGATISFPSEYAQPNLGSQENFATGLAMSNDGNRFAIGDPAYLTVNGQTRPGRVFIYRYENNLWINESRLDGIVTPTAEFADKRFGTSLTWNGLADTLFVSAPNPPAFQVAFNGSIDKYSRVGNSWTYQFTYDSGTSLSLSESVLNFGVDIAMNRSGTLLLVSNRSESAFSPQMTLFENGLNISIINRYIPPNPPGFDAPINSSPDTFGYELSISENAILAVGSLRGNSPGGLYIYE